MPKRALSEFFGALETPGSSQHEAAGLLKTTYYLRPGDAKALKLRALQEGRTVSELAREAISLYLSREGEIG